MGCQIDTATAIIVKNADYILVVKENQALLHQDIEDEFRFALQIKTTISQELDHGRIETRKCIVITNFQFITPNNKWNKLNAIIKIDGTREFKN